ncbi:MAG TPA: DUF2281 domain-containing protein [Candidatus Hydrogenedentes bacterium]|nr:DUF2281 domain-containing protein [Candidatus Hydrogenedentota bacterium]
MTLTQEIAERIRELPQDKQQELLDFLESLTQEGTKKPKRCLKGLWAHLNIDISESEINDIRKEMWGSFPREGNI